MSLKIVDCRGLACPQPVINTKKALDEGAGSVTTIVDNDVSRRNVTLFAQNAGYTVSEENKDGVFHLTISSQGRAVPQTTEQPGACPAPDTPGQVYFITTNALGQGSPDLGHVLIKSLFTTLAAMDTPPAALLFLNTGVFLACTGSPVLEQLEQLSNAGTAVLACGTCLEYYKIKDKLKYGNISNMFDINNWLCKNHSVITIA